MPQALKFVLCPPYHGATALAFLLNNHPSLSCLGDTLPWEDRNQSCSCGLSVDDCAFWRELRQRITIERRQGEAQMLPLLPRILASPVANKYAARTMLSAAWLLGPAVRHIASSATTELSDIYQDFYSVIRELHGTKYVVDGSKSIGKILSLSLLGEQPVRCQVLHLIRDPRGYAYSLKRRHLAPSPLGRAGSEWKRTHRSIELLFRWQKRFDYLAIRYEDLCTDTEATLAKAFSFFGVPPADVCHASQDQRKNHIIGNRMLKTFNGVLRLDTRWQHELTPDEQQAVLDRAGRVALAHGYS
jgi:hypothetical protein